MNAQKTAVTSTTDVKLDMATDALPYASGTSTDIGSLRSIDWQKPAEKQTQALGTFSLALGTLATRLFAA